MTQALIGFQRSGDPPPAFLSTAQAVRMSSRERGIGHRKQAGRAPLVGEANSMSCASSALPGLASPWLGARHRCWPSRWDFTRSSPRTAR